jgi:VWFA-related protein
MTMGRVHCLKVPTGLVMALLVAGSAAGQKFTDTSQVTVVEVPVQVVRDGEPVRGLKVDDFVLTEGRQQQAITGFDVVDLAAPENRVLSADIPAAGKRHFLLLFDFANSSPKTMGKAKAAVMQSLIKTLTPSDLVAVASYSPRSGLRLLLGFTSDLYQVTKVIASLGVEKNDRPEAYDTGVMASNVAEAIASLTSLNLPPPPPPPDATPIQRGQEAVEQAKASAEGTSALQLVSEYASEVLEMQHAEIAQQKTSLAPMAGAFSDLARMMSGVSGRKLVVLLSEGFDTGVVSGTEDFNGQQAMADATMNGGSIAVDNDARFGSTQMANLLEKMLEQFRRSDCVIESLDISGLRGQSFDDATPQTSGEGALLQMSHDTGGEVFRNTNDLGAALVRMANQTSVTYVLSFQPQGLKQDGAYHPIKVQLKNAPRGTRVSARSGYYAPRPFNQQRPVEKMLSLANQLMGANQGGSIATAVLAEPFRTAGAKAYVPVFVEADGASLLAGSPDKVLAAEIYVYAVDADGIIQDFLNQRLAVDVAKVGPALRQGGLKYYGHLELPPGRYAVRSLVRNSETGGYGKRTVFLTVPRFAADASVLLPPLFPEAGGRWSVVRETPRGEQKDTAYPFHVGQQAYVPASLPALAPGAAVPLALMGYNLGQDPKTDAKLESADGRDLGACTVRVRGEVPGDGTGPDVYQALFLAPTGLAPGDYRLVVTVNAAGGPQSATSAFTVAGAGVSQAAPAKR